MYESGKHEHQLGQKCPAKNAKCKECHKIGHFHKVCQSKMRATQRVQLAQIPWNDDDDTHINEIGSLSALTHQAMDYKPSKEHDDNFNQLKMEVSNIGALP